jgi:hypothetical protein
MKNSSENNPETKTDKETINNHHNIDILDRVLFFLFGIGSLLVGAFGSDQLHFLMVLFLFFTIVVGLFDLFRHVTYKWKWYAFTFLSSVVFISCSLWEIQHRRPSVSLPPKVSEEKNTDRKIKHLSPPISRPTVTKKEALVSQQTASIFAPNSNIFYGTNTGTVNQTITNELPQQRTIAQDKLNLIQTELSKHRGESMHIVCTMNDQEAFSFASQLKSLFESSGWSVDSIEFALFVPPIKGATIAINNKSDEPEAKYIYYLFKDAGFTFRAEVDKDSLQKIKLKIGSK